MTKSSMMRAVERDRSVHEIVEANRLSRDDFTRTARGSRARSRAAISAGVSAQHVRSYLQAPPACSAASRFALSSSGVQ